MRHPAAIYRYLLSLVCATDTLSRIPIPSTKKPLWKIERVAAEVKCEALLPPRGQLTKGHITITLECTPVHELLFIAVKVCRETIICNSMKG